MYNQLSNEKQKQAYQFPPVSLLTARKMEVDDREAFDNTAERLVSVLRGLGVEAQIIGASRGPTVTQYKLKLNTAIRKAEIFALSTDIATNFAVDGIRIEMPVPHEPGVMHIEIPNRRRMIGLREILETPEFAGADNGLPIVLGKDSANHAVMADLTKLPHLLIGGMTGSGKSVFLNSMIISLLYKCTPDEVRFILIDPKMLEFEPYNGIPHLLIPAATDPEKAVWALQWAVEEMMRRYRLMADAKVRNLEKFNLVAANSEKFSIMPRIVVVIDALADLTLTAAKEVEGSICRIAQMGRAAGIHLVAATQRPSVEVISGLIKANIPSRIAFTVTSATGSRTILDTRGAEKLMGMGDMLYAPIGISKPIRIQGAWVSDEEREKVVAFVKNQRESQYSNEVISQIEQTVVDKSSFGGKAEEESINV